METMVMIGREFWLNKRVLVTGHTGFKGGWLSLWLELLGARVFGVALPPQSAPNLFEKANIVHGIESHYCDIRDFDNLKVEDESIDWIIEFDSLHHSFDLERTAKESYRVLKDGGTLIAIDRAHWNTSRERMRSLENEPYSQEFLLTRGWDPNTKITRADNGEHEHLVSDYQKHEFLNI